MLRLLRAPVGLILVLALPACDSSTAPAPVLSLPPRFQLAAEASGTDPSGITTDCHLDLHIELTGELRRDTGLVEYSGKYGGGAGRSVLAPDGSGLGFFADLVGSVVARRFAPDSVEVELPGNQRAESRFWRGLGYFAGTLAPGARHAGIWQCAPFDITEGGYVDTSGFGAGTWRMAPFP